MLVVHNITLAYHSKIIFEKLGFSLVRGSALQILGTNGSGKTSLLKVIARLISNKQGKITFNGYEVDKFLEEYYSMMLYIPDIAITDDGLTVLANLQFWAKLYGTQECMDAAIHTWNLGHLLYHKVVNISQGWRKKVSLARLLLLPRALIWLLDEPFTYLDQESIKTLVSIIKIRCERGGIVMFSSNYSHELYTEHRDFINNTACLIMNDFAPFDNKK